MSWRRQLEPDLVEELFLPGRKLPTAHKLKRRQKDPDDPRTGHIVIEEARERHPPLLRHERLDAGGVCLDRRVVMNDLPRAAFLPLGHHPRHSPNEIPDMHVGDRHLRRRHPTGRVIRGLPREPQFPVPGPILEHRGGVAILLVFEQPLHQVLADEFDRLLHLLGARHEGPRLDLEEHAGEIDKLAHLLDGEPLEDVEVGDELGGDGSDRHFRHIHLVLLDEIEEQVHRPGKDIEVDFELHDHLAAAPRDSCRTPTANHREPRPSAERRIRR